MLKNIKLRIIWLIPTIFMWLMFIGFSIWVFVNAEGLIQIEMLSSWVLKLLFLFIISLLGSYRMWSWIKEGKL
ncbi:hypothetical protein [Halalkalibacter urbisdiaboli]|uniref:hypothetical protein n=1 Tax=Halalkalibacter urbisdiaboli TaxID=1960589 RepID=UPI001FD972B7|nr:hypothetical protein [Halalkalibacter urbisdiaboli]